MGALHKMDKLTEEINQALTDEQVLTDIARLLSDAEWKAVLDEQELIIPKDAKIDIVDKVFFHERYDVEYGDSFRVLAAIGGVASIEHGFLTPTYCFITLHY